MADTTDTRPLTVSVSDVAVHYQVHADGGRGSMRAWMARGFRPRPARTIDAVRGVSFEVHQGEAVGLIGSNGSGKSTLLRAVAGLLPVSNGRIRASSQPVLLSVSPAFNPRLSGRANVHLGGVALGMSRDEAASMFDDIVEFAGVGEFIDLPLQAYSSGMKARLQFAVASAIEPEILLVDEALAVGDAAFQRKSEQRMRGLLARAGTVILVSHSAKQVVDLCDRAIWLDRGVVRADGPAEEVAAAYEAAQHS